MAQTTRLIETLKLALKSHGKTYRDVANKLGLSEASVKRLFANQSLSLQRLDEICQLIDMEISELVHLMNAKTTETQGLSEAQEQQIVDDPHLLLVAVCVLNKFTFAEILEEFELDETQLIQNLAHLDRLKVIDLLPKNRIKLLISPDFTWRVDGPIQRFFHAEVAQEFFASRFHDASEKFISLTGLLSLGSNEQFQRKMDRLADEFSELRRDDERLPLRDRFGTTIVLAIRKWEFGLFEQLKRQR